MDMDTDSDVFISIAEAARILGMSRGTVHRLAKLEDWPRQVPGPPHPSTVSRAAVLAYKAAHRPNRGQPADPQTPAEWQVVVNTAQLLLLIDSARQYGLLEGGPEVNVERCEELLLLGAAQGYTPTETPELVAAWLEE